MRGENMMARMVSRRFDGKKAGLVPPEVKWEFEAQVRDGKPRSQEGRIQRNAGTGEKDPKWPSSWTWTER